MLSMAVAIILKGISEVAKVLKAMGHIKAQVGATSVHH